MQRSISVLILAVASVILSVPAQAGWDQAFKLKPSDGAVNDEFSNSVALSGNTALVGNWLDDDNGSASGSAYLFNTTTGAQITKLTPADGAIGDYFGHSVALSGNTALVGSPYDEDNGFGSGSAYLFNATTGAQLAKLKPADGAMGDGFGGSVALSGNTALVSSRFDGDNGLNSGSAYLFNATTGTQLAKLLPADGATGDRFGLSVALSGNTALVGSFQDDDNGSESGSAYLFDATTGAQLAKLKPSDGAVDDEFGYSVALSGNTALIGSYQDDDNGDASGSAYLFNATTGAQIAKLLPVDGAARDYFGYSVALSGNIALVGNIGDDDNGNASGSSYLFNATTGVQLAKLKPADGAAGDNFGISVALSGNAALVGSFRDDDNGTNSGSAYLFAMDVLDPNPVSGGTITFSPITPGVSLTLDDIPSIVNSGGAGSKINVTGFGFSGPNPSLFDLPGYSNVTLTAGAFDTIAYDLTFLGSAAAGDYAATLTLFTDSGNVSYNIQASVIPEPSTLGLLALGGLALLLRRRK
ncbi:MAG: FG-GAP repeat protein [Pirellulales bacterium]|nr:FG-GAP repeat protein [Pirellulales bacterium]